MASRTTYCDGITRRAVLQIGSTGIMGLTLPNLLRLEAQARASAGARALDRRKATAVILVRQGGGPPTIDMWDLKPDAPDDIRGEFRPIDTNVPGIQISEHLPRMARVMDRVTLVRSLTHPVAEHGFASTWMFSGNVPTPVLRYPHLGALAAKILPNVKGVPPFVKFGEGGFGGGRFGGYLGPAYSPFFASIGGSDKVNPSSVQLRGITLPATFPLEELEDREKLLADFDQGFQAADRASDLADSMDAFHQKALDLLRSEKTRQAFNLAKEPQALLSRYGLNGSGMGLIVARRLIEAGACFVSVDVGKASWDSHQANFRVMKEENLPVLDPALATLLEDLDDRGMLDTTLVYACGEFGRTPLINKDAGRDHWSRSQTVVLAGGGIRRGSVYGSTDARGMDPASAACAPDDVAATVFHCLGIEPTHELMTTTGRPIRLFREGKVLKGILA
jgi:hypothetical protein